MPYNRVNVIFLYGIYCTRYKPYSSKKACNGKEIFERGVPEVLRSKGAAMFIIRIALIFGFSKNDNDRDNNPEGEKYDS